MTEPKLVLSVIAAADSIAELPPLERGISRKRNREQFVRQFLRELSGGVSGLDVNRSNRSRSSQTS